MYTWPWTCTFYIANDLHLFVQTYFFYMLLQNHCLHHTRTYAVQISQFRRSVCDMKLSRFLAASPTRWTTLLPGRSNYMTYANRTLTLLTFAFCQIAFIQSSAWQSSGETWSYCLLFLQSPVHKSSNLVS